MLKAYYQISIISRKKITKNRKKISKSFTSNFVKALYSMLFGGTSTYTTFYDYAGTGRYTYWGYHTTGVLQLSINSCHGDIRYYSNNISVVNPAGGDWGIMLGTGTDAVIPTDDNMVTPITHGTSSGQMQYLAGFFSPDVTISSSNASFTIERLFLNSSGGNVTVNEIGGYVNMSSIICCILRDLVSPAVVVANGEYLKVAYTIQVTC